MIITRTSELTGKEHSLDINISEEELYRVENRRMLDLKIQEIMPHIPADQREFLITGIIDSEWQEAFGSDEDEDDGQRGTPQSDEIPAW